MSVKWSELLQDEGTLSCGACWKMGSICWRKFQISEKTIVFPLPFVETFQVCVWVLLSVKPPLFGKRDPFFTEKNSAPCNKVILQSSVASHVLHARNRVSTELLDSSLSLASPHSTDLGQLLSLHMKNCGLT